MSAITLNSFLFYLNIFIPEGGGWGNMTIEGVLIIILEPKRPLQCAECLDQCGHSIDFNNAQQEFSLTSFSCGNAISTSY